MYDYDVTFARSAREDLELLSTSVINRIFPRIEDLAQNPRPRRCRKIEGSENLWRIRIGDYRVIYEVLDDKRLVDIVAVRHRSQAYRRR